LTGPYIWKVKGIKQAKGNECSQYRSTAAIVSSSLPICPKWADWRKKSYDSTVKPDASADKKI
jgi:hypothetical protein